MKKTYHPLRTIGIILLTPIILIPVIIFSIWFYIHIYQVNNYARYWDNRAHQPGQLLYVALGDSATQGIGATSPDKSYVSSIATKISSKTGKSVQVINLSKSGAKMQDLTNDQLPKLKQLHPDIISVAIGGNDALNNTLTLQQFEEQFSALATLLPPQTYLADLPYLDDKHGYKYSIRSHQLLDQLSQNNNLHPVHLHEATQPHFHDFSYYSIDLLHPSNKSYQVWTQTFWNAIKPNLAL